MIELPNFLPLRITQAAANPTSKDFDSLDHVAIVVCGRRVANLFRGIPNSTLIGRAFDRAVKRQQKSATLQLDNARGTEISVHKYVATTPFDRLTAARRVASQALQPGVRRVGMLCLGASEQEQREILLALAAAAGAARFEMPAFKSSKSQTPRTSQLRLLSAPKLPLARINAEIGANNLARWLTALPPNKLTAAAYRGAVGQLATSYGLKVEFFDEKKLEKLGAGAFLAVSQGNRERDAGIVKLSYRPTKGGSPELALIGKGILFDTGGTNLKPFKGMLEMHTDMQGSAVALATGVALAQLEVPFAFDVWLAITANRISSTAYTSQDVVTAANGLTIQVIHTDAEGRMVLADTLALAAREKPKLMIDFATLTGTCVAALTSRYSGVFTNRPAANFELIANGKECGERVWAFPMDDDYDDALASEVADIKQCSADGYGDHILAARFLRRFVPESTPWVHMDLSAGQQRGGLGHIPTEITGFGIRYSLALLLDRFQGPSALAASMS
jgi:leucyl aminopeptidase